MSLTIKINKFCTIQVVCMLDLLFAISMNCFFLGVFLDMMNLIFRKKLKSKSGKQDSMGKSQQKTIISTSLQFLKMLARYGYF